MTLQLTVQYGRGAHHAYSVGKGTDLSSSGVFVLTQQPEQVGSMVYLKLALIDGTKLVEGFGRVARIVGSNNGCQPGMGVQFIHLDEQSIGLLEQTLARELGGDGGPI